MFWLPCIYFNISSIFEHYKVRATANLLPKTWTFYSLLRCMNDYLFTDGIDTWIPIPVISYLRLQTSYIYDSAPGG